MSNQRLVLMPNDEKHFFGIPVAERTPALLATSNRLLQGKTSKYPPHMSLLTMLVKRNSTAAANMNRWKEEFFTQLIERPILYLEDVEAKHYAVLGNNPECFCLVLTPKDLAYYEDLRTRWCIFLESKGVTVGFGTDSGAEVRLTSAPLSEKKLHVTLLSSFDLKRYNKGAYKAYRQAEDKLAYLQSLYGSCS